MIESLVESRLGALPARAAPSLAVQLPSGRLLGDRDAPARVILHDWAPLLHLARGQVGQLAGDYAEGRLDLQGPLRAVCAAAAGLLDQAPTAAASTGLLQFLQSWWRHRPSRDAAQVQQHYDVSDDFYALWLDPRRVYSCAYWREPGMTLAQAQEAKLDHICRKLMLRPGERFLDIGAGWGGLLLWAAQQHGVMATGITLSRNQHAYVNRLIDERGLRGRVRMLLLDYRDLPEDEPWHKIASVGMFEHVGRARLAGYFAKIARLLAPGGLLLNHGITAGGTRHAALGAGIGEFIERYIFPGGELQHVSRVLRVMAEQGLEGLDTENLRPHYARTLWAWSDALEARIERAHAHRRAHAARLPPVPGRQRAGFRARLDGLAPDAGRRPRRTIGVPVQPTLHVRRPMIYKFRSKATGDVIMLAPHGDQLLKILGREPAPKGIFEVAAMPAAVAALRAAIAAEAAADRAAGPEDADAPEGPRAVSLRQRLWPMIDMLERAHAEGQPVVWGV